VIRNASQSSGFPELLTYVASAGRILEGVLYRDIPCYGRPHDGGHTNLGGVLVVIQNEEEKKGQTRKRKRNKRERW